MWQYAPSEEHSKVELDNGVRVDVLKMTKLTATPGLSLSLCDRLSSPPTVASFSFVCSRLIVSSRAEKGGGVTLETLEPTRTEYVQYTNKKKIETTLQNYFKFHGKIMQLKI